MNVRAVIRLDLGPLVGDDGQLGIAAVGRAWHVLASLPRNAAVDLVLGDARYLSESLRALLLEQLEQAGNVTVCGSDVGAVQDLWHYLARAVQ